MICGECQNLTTEIKGDYIRCLNGIWTRFKAIRMTCVGEPLIADEVLTSETVYCDCGCGGTFERDQAKKGRRRQYILGHSPCRQGKAS